MRDYLEDWLSEGESVVLPSVKPAAARKALRQSEQEENGGGAAGQASGKQIGNDGARMVWTEKLEAGGDGTEEKMSGPTAAEQTALPMALAERQARQAARGALYTAMGKVGRVERLALGEERGRTVPLPLPAWPQGTETVEHLDRAVQRDARRYDGGFSLY